MGNVFSPTTYRRSKRFMPELTMQEYVHQIHALLAEADELPISETKLGLLEEAVRLADSHGDIPLGIQAREPLMFVARNLLRGDILAVAFTWSLSHYDRDPSLFQGRDLFWEYEMVIGQLANLDSVPRTKLEELLSDFGRRLQESGQSLAVVYETRRTIAPDLGDRAMALTAEEELRRFPAFERGSVRHRFECLMFLGREEEALTLAEPYLHNNPRGIQSDVEWIRCYALLPLLKQGRVQEVAHWQDHCARHIKPEMCYYWSYGEVIKSLALTGKIAQAVRVYERCQRAIKEFTDPLTRLHFALDAIVLFDRLANLQQNTVALRLPPNVPIVKTSQGYLVAEVRNWLHQEAKSLAARFDQRNGTDYFTDQLRQRVKLQQWALSEIDGNPGDQI
jgi:hypothetical protein